MNKKVCPIGLEDCILSETNSCLNFLYCYAWTRPWPLPLLRIDRHVCPSDFLVPYWFVQIRVLYPPINTENVMQQYNWEEDFAEYGYAEAELLPVKPRPLDRPFFLDKQKRTDWLRRYNRIQ